MRATQPCSKAYPQPFSTWYSITVADLQHVLATDELIATSSVSFAVFMIHDASAQTMNTLSTTGCMVKHQRNSMDDLILANICVLSRLHSQRHDHDMSRGLQGHTLPATNSSVLLEPLDA